MGDFSAKLQSRIILLCQRAVDNKLTLSKTFMISIETNKSPVKREKGFSFFLPTLSRIFGVCFSSDKDQRLM